MSEQVETGAAPASAAATITAEPAAAPAATAPAAGGSAPGEGQAETPASAAAALLAPGEGGEKPKGDEAPSGEGAAKEEKAVDLASMTDEDYAKAVQPDVEGEEVDRSLITPMAKELRAAGVQPSVMSQVAKIYAKVVRAEVARADAARAKRMEELTAKALKEITPETRRDFAAVYNAHIKGDPELNEIVLHTELGSNPAFIRLLALAGATLRSETPPPASASAGSGQTNLERAVFEATVPKDLR